MLNVRIIVVRDNGTVDLFGIFNHSAGGFKNGNKEEVKAEGKKGR